MQLKAWRQCDLWQFHSLQAVGLLADLTEEVGVLVVVMVMAVAVAEFVLRAVAAALNGMYQMMLAEQGEGTEHIRLVDGRYPALQFRQRLRQHGGGQFPHHHDAVCSGLDTVLFEQSDTSCFVHFRLFVGKGTTFLVENEGVSEKMLNFAIGIRTKN